MVSTKQAKSSPRNSAQMFPLIRAWESSGLSQKEFCAERGIKVHLFYYWLKRYREQDGSDRSMKAGFVTVEVEPSPEPVVLAEILYGDGTRLVLRERVGAGFLRALLAKPK
jgi:hypothetical protein